MPDQITPEPHSKIVFYQAEDGRSRIQVRLEGNTVWLSQRLIAELFQKDVRTINEHLQNIFDEGELAPEATIRKFRIVQTEGNREVSRLIDYYNLDAILAVGYRVKSHRGTQFRRWATELNQKPGVHDAFHLVEKPFRVERSFGPSMLPAKRMNERAVAPLRISSR